MAIDSAEKRKSVAGIGLPCYGPSVTPNAATDSEWRQQSGYSYSGFAALTPPSVAQLMAWRFTPPDFAYGRRPNVRTGLFTLEPIYQVSATETITIDKWLGCKLDWMWGHKPRPHGGMFAANPIRPDPSLEMWEFKPSDFAGRRSPRAVDTGVFTVDPTTPVDPAPEMSWQPKYPVFSWRLKSTQVRGIGEVAPLWHPELLTADKWINYLPAMVPKNHAFAASRSWYHPAYQAPFTVDDFAHTDHIRAAWWMMPSVTGSFGSRPAINGVFEIDLSMNGTQGINP